MSQNKAPISLEALHDYFEAVIKESSRLLPLGAEMTVIVSTPDHGDMIVTAETVEKVEQAIARIKAQGRPAGRST